MPSEEEIIKPQTHTLLSNSQKGFIINQAVLSIAEGTKPKLIKREIQERYQISIPVVNALFKQAQQAYLEGVQLLSKENYLKDSVEKLEEYENKAAEIYDRAKRKNRLKEAAMAIKEGRDSLKDRNELLGIQKGNVAIQINFDSVNFTDRQFLDVYNNQTTQPESSQESKTIEADILEEDVDNEKT